MALLAQLDSLPHEILLKILGFLPTNDLVSLAQGGSPCVPWSIETVVNRSWAIMAEEGFKALARSNGWRLVLADIFSLC